MTIWGPILSVSLLIGYHPSSCPAFFVPVESGVRRPDNPHRLVAAVAVDDRPLFLTVLHDTAGTDTDALSQRDTAAAAATVDVSNDIRETLLTLVKAAPRGRATPPLLTRHILDCVRSMEGSCPTSFSNDGDDDGERRQIPQRLAGTWELLWTAQDPRAPESQPSLPPLLSFAKTWINPLENQAYSNNPGQANPFLPVAVQNRLEQAGLTSAIGVFASPQAVSTQSIDIKTRQIRNIVTVQWDHRPLRNDNTNNENDDIQRRRTTSTTTTAATLTVLIRFTPDRLDSRRINVKFDACRVAIPRWSIDWDFPLGWIGPTGWLRTVYLDDVVRVTRGHKGSVFVLARPSWNRREPRS